MITIPELARMVDLTNLNPDATDEDIEMLVKEAVEEGFGAVCIRPDKVRVADAYIRRDYAGQDIRIVSVVGFPERQADTATEMIRELSAYSADYKVKEARYAISEGVSEIDMVIDLGAMKSGRYDGVEGDIKAVVKASGAAAVKVIIETCYLTEPEKQYACRLTEKAGAAYVKTSTGYGVAGAALDDVLLMGKMLKAGTGIKASGGIHKWEFALELYAASQRHKPHPFRLGSSRLE